MQQKFALLAQWSSALLGGEGGILPALQSVTSSAASASCSSLADEETWVRIPERAPNFEVR